LQQVQYYDKGGFMLWFTHSFLLVLGIFLGVLIAANNEDIAKWISKKVSNKLDKKG